MERRSFLRRIAVLLGAVVSFVFLVPVMKFLAPQKLEAQAEKITINKSEIPYGEAMEVAFNGTPLIVINRKGKGFIALSRVCTHLGCLVGYNRDDEELVCPCHAANFSLEGSVISGPAPSPLESFPLKVEADHIIIG